ncbi:MAG: hypothetical protein V1774_11625, partial [Candidatus Eisenbacteria bacterium]
MVGRFCRMFAKVLGSALVLGVLLVTIPAAGGEQIETPRRDQIDAKYQWDLSAMYGSDAAWEEDVKAVEAQLPVLRGFEGKIHQSPQQFLAFMKVYAEVWQRLDNVTSYASMSYDQNTADQKYIGFKERGTTTVQAVSDAASWFGPAVTAVPRETWEKWFAETPDLQIYRQYIDNLLRTQAHTLSAPEEKILALSYTLANAPLSTNVALREADLQFPTVKDEDGNDVQLSEGRMMMLLESPDPAVRRNAALTMLQTYGQFKNTAAALMAG